MVAFLRAVTGQVQKNLDQENARAFLFDLGSAFHALLIEHIRQFSISDTGALLLRKYQNYPHLFCILYYCPVTYVHTRKPWKGWDRPAPSSPITLP